MIIRASHMHPPHHRCHKTKVVSLVCTGGSLTLIGYTPQCSICALLVSHGRAQCKQAAVLKAYLIETFSLFSDIARCLPTSIIIYHKVAAACTCMQ